MKHHFADMLDRSGGYWTMTPNQARWRCHFGDLADAPGDVSRLLVTKDDRNWRKALDCQNLVELTLHEPSQEQLAALPDFPPLKALRISHARPASLAVLESQPALQELVLEYVSRVDDLAPVGALPCLTALHLENLRGVSDFSALGAARALRYLAIYGTLDWNQPIRSLDFLAQLGDLEHLEFGFGVRFPAAPFPLAALLAMKKLRELKIPMDMLPLEDFAWIQVRLPHVEGAIRPACKPISSGEKRKIDHDDIRATMPLEEFTQLSGACVGPDGVRYQIARHEAILLGKGNRYLYGTAEKVAEKCRAHEEKYRRLLEKCQQEYAASA